MFYIPLAIDLSRCLLLLDRFTRFMQLMHFPSVNEASAPSSRPQSHLFILFNLTPTNSNLQAYDNSQSVNLQKELLEV